MTATTASAMARLMAKVAVAPSGCWEFTGQRDSDGYGWFSLECRKVRAHRAAWMLRFGEIPPGLFALHRCDNPPCVNPHHMFLGTQADNIADRDAKGRARPSRGEAHWRAKLTEADVRAIRAAVSAGSTHREVAAQYGIARSGVTKIMLGLRWAAVDPDQE